MSTSGSAYLLAGQVSELERLQLQSRVWEPAGRALLDRLGSGQGLRALDVGCGCFGWLRLLLASTSPLPEEQAVTAMKDGRLVPEVREIIALMKEHDACLATAHLSAAESHSVVREARNQGLRRIIVSHAKWAMTGLTLEDLKDFAGQGCLVELEASLMMPIMYFVH